MKRAKRNVADAQDASDDAKIKSARQDGFFTPREMAQMLCLSEFELIALARAGIVRRVLLRVKGGVRGGIRTVYDVRQAVPAYIRHIGEPARVARDELVLERSETQRVLRAHRQLDLDVARGDMVSRAKVVLAVGAVLSAVKAQVLSLPTRCTRLLVAQRDPKKVHAILKQHASSCLRGVDELAAEDVLKHSRNGHKSFDDQSAKNQRRRVRARRDR